MTNIKALGNAEYIDTARPNDSAAAKAQRVRLLGFRDTATTRLGKGPGDTARSLYRAMLTISAEFAFAACDDEVLTDAREACILLLRAADRVERLYVTGE
jgi:hypothetical protein